MHSVQFSQPQLWKYLCTFQRPLYDHAFTSWLISQISASVYSHNLPPCWSCHLVDPEHKCSAFCSKESSQLAAEMSVLHSWEWDRTRLHPDMFERIRTLTDMKRKNCPQSLMLIYSLCCCCLALLLQVWQKALLNNKINMRCKISRTIFLSSFVTKVHLGSI